MLDPLNELTEAVRLAADRPHACKAVRDIYARLQLEIDRRKPICVASGKCCHFESYGHRLYVTTLELAAFVNDLRANAVHLTDKLTLTPALSPITGRGGQRSKTLIVYRENAPAGDGCPLQKENLCSVHAIRPFGCRIFFCDTTATQWQQERYELFHAELKQLHERFDVPYFYVEWRSALAAIGVSG